MRGYIVVTGAHGQVGRALLAQLGDRAIALTRDQLDLSRPETLFNALDSIDKPIVAIINAAAYTAVDKAEEEEALATIINGEAPAILASYAKQYAIPFIHYSTDYVFNGEGNTPWEEGDTTQPLNAYGRSKHAGEQAIQEVGGDYIIFRTSWVYDKTGANFVNTMLKLAKARETLAIVNDQFGAPSYAPDIARVTLAALETALEQSTFPSGIYHLCGRGETSWHGFASEIFAKARQNNITLIVDHVEGVPSTAYPTPAKRPQNSRMSTAKLKRIFNNEMLTWQEALDAYFT